MEIFKYMIYGPTYWNGKRTMIIEPDSDLQRLWARDTADLGALDVFHFITFLIPNNSDLFDQLL